MKDSLSNKDILYVNRLLNIVYSDGEILETNISRIKKEIPKETIFDIFARILTKNSEQRKVLYHITFDKEDYTRISLCKRLSLLYGKSDRTYSRAIDYLFGKRIIIQNKHRILKVPIEYDLSLLDLDNVKSVMIHIN